MPLYCSRIRGVAAGEGTVYKGSSVVLKSSVQYHNIKLIQIIYHLIFQPRKRSKPCRKPSVCGSSSSETDIFDVISEVAPRAGILLCLRPKCDLQGFQVGR